MKKLILCVILSLFMFSGSLNACDSQSIENKIIRENSGKGALNDLIECEQRGELDAELYWSLYNLHSTKNGNTERYNVKELDVNLDYLCKSVQKGYYFAINELVKVMKMNIPGPSIENNYAVANCLENILLVDDFMTLSSMDSVDYIVDLSQVEHCLNVDVRVLIYNECL